MVLFSLSSFVKSAKYSAVLDAFFSKFLTLNIKSTVVIAQPNRNKNKPVKLKVITYLTKVFWWVVQESNLRQIG